MAKTPDYPVVTSDPLQSPIEQEVVAEQSVEVPIGPQPLLDEHVYKTIVNSDPRVTHKAMTQEEEIEAAKQAEKESKS